MKNYILILLLSASSFFTHAQKKDKTWVFILAGQSNMAGRGAIDFNPFNGDTITNQRIQTINQNGEIVLAKEPLHFYEPKMAGLDCGLSFARTMLLSIPEDVTILLIPTAVGGSSIKKWIDDSVHRGVPLWSNFKHQVEIAKKYNTRFHAYHISTELETHLFKYNGALRDKRITSEACVHHLWFTDKDYDRLGHFIKWNPSIKSENNKLGLIKALNNNIVDIIATDHAPHLLSEKKGDYFQSKSGGPLVQHALVTLLELYHQGYLSLEKIVEKTSHHVAEIYRMVDRGYIREGYFADIVLVDLNDKWNSTSNLNLYKCGWSPFDNYTFSSKVIQTYVNGHLAYDRGVFNNSELGRRLLFEKNR